MLLQKVFIFSGIVSALIAPELLSPRDEGNEDTHSSDLTIGQAAIQEPHLGAVALPRWLTHPLETRALSCPNGIEQCIGYTCPKCGGCCGGDICAPNFGVCCSVNYVCPLNYNCCDSGGSKCCAVDLTFCCSTSAGYVCCLTGATCTSSGCSGSLTYTVSHLTSTFSTVVTSYSTVPAATTTKLTTVLVTTTFFTTVTVTSSSASVATITNYVTSTAFAKRTVDWEPSVETSSISTEERGDKRVPFPTPAPQSPFEGVRRNLESIGLLQKRVITSWITDWAFVWQTSTSIINGNASTSIIASTSTIASTSVISSTLFVGATSTKTILSTIIITSTSGTTTGPSTTQPTTITSSISPSTTTGPTTGPSTTTTSDSTTTTSHSSTPTPNPPGGLTPAAKAGIGAGLGIAGLALIIGLILLFLKKKKSKRDTVYDPTPIKMETPGAAGVGQERVQSPAPVYSPAPGYVSPVPGGGGQGQPSPVRPVGGGFAAHGGGYPGPNQGYQQAGYEVGGQAVEQQQQGYNYPTNAAELR